MIKKTIFSLLTIFIFLQTGLACAEVNVNEFKTKKNIHVIFVNDNSSDLTTIQFAFKNAGSAFDPKGKEGLTALMTQLLLEGDKQNNDKMNLNKNLKNLGALSGLQFGVTADHIVYTIKVPTEKLKETFVLLKPIFTNKSFDQSELDNLKNFDPPDARLASANEKSFANKILIQTLFQGHPYSVPNYGTLDGRQSITLSDVIDCANQRFSRQNLVFSIIGNIPKNKISDLSSYIDSAFGSLPEKNTSNSLNKPNINTNGQLALIPKSTPQSGVVFGQQAISVKDDDYFPMLIVNEIIGGKPFTSRLWTEAREERGLVYDIQTHFTDWEHASLWLGSFESDNAKVNEVIHLIRNQWQKIKTEGITEDEFKTTKTGLMGSFVLKFTTPDGIASYLLGCYLKNLPMDYMKNRNAMLEKVTLEDVNRVAKQYLKPEELTFVIVGDPENKLTSKNEELPS